MSDDLLNDLDYMAMNAVIKGSTPERAAARIRELEAECRRLALARMDAAVDAINASDAAWDAALEEAAEVALEETPDSHDSWEYAKQIAAAIRKLKREAKE